MPSLSEKIRILGAAGKYDICASTSCASNESIETSSSNLLKNNKPSFGSTLASGICHSFTPDGRCVSLFKVLFSNSCVFNCKYCFNKVNRTITNFTPEEYVKAFMYLYLGNYCEGAFLSSGISKNPDDTMEKMLESVITLREKYNFRGYIHFKCLPGASREIVRRATQYADRMSINLESPNDSRLSDIASQKSLKSDILKRQEWIREEEGKKFEDWENIDNMESFDINSCRISNLTRCEEKYRNARKLPAGQTTQFVVGAAGESDLEILQRLDWEYKRIKLRRGYFSAFFPIKGTSLESKSPTPLVRENRLYQTDWLMRVYKIPFKDITPILTENDNLPRKDPKVCLANIYFEGKKPVDINEAPYSELIRIPGIGIQSASRIITLRNNGEKITKRAQLKSIGCVLKRAEPFIKIDSSFQSVLDKFMN